MNELNATEKTAVIFWYAINCMQRELCKLVWEIVDGIGKLEKNNSTTNWLVETAGFFHMRDFRRIRNTLDLQTAKTVATSIFHARLEYCNSLFLNLPPGQLNRLQL